MLKKPKKIDAYSKIGTTSELRQDLVSGDWVIIAPRRSSRPDQFKKTFCKENSRQSIKNCPFENPQLSGHDVPYLVIPKKSNKKDWAIQVVRNKFPALDGGTQRIKKEGPYKFRDGFGHHEIVILRDHKKDLAQLSSAQFTDLIKAYVLRYQELALMPHIDYVSIFHNHGSSAGASMQHPHSQIIALPIIPPDVSHSIKGSLNFFHQYGKCAHCVIVDFERKARVRIVCENKTFIAFAPFASKQSFEVRIIPKVHMPQFEFLDAEQIDQLADIFSSVLKKINKTLDNPDYNFYLHTSPVAARDFDHYHWHFEILPRRGLYAGFELSTNIIVVSTAPEEAAKILRHATL